MSDPAKLERARTYNPRSWAFWRKRLARALVLGALVLGATQVLPQLPRDQAILVLAPEGARFTELNLTYFIPGEPEALGGTSVSFPTSLQRFPHSIRLANGKYSVLVEAKGVSSTGSPLTWTVKRPLTLQGGRTRLQLPLPQPLR